MLLRVDSLAGTHAIAAALAGLARPGDIIVLAGEMGAGKTAFAQAFGKAIGVVETMTSPTFTLVHSHPCPGRKLTVHHADLYRLDTTSDVDDLALTELAEFDGIVLVEWGDVAAASLGDHLEVRILRDDDVSEDPFGDGDLDELDDLDDPDGGGRSDGHRLGDDRADPDDEFGLDEARTIELHASGASWAGRWDRLAEVVGAYRC